MSNEYKDYIREVKGDLKKLLEDYNMSIELNTEEGFPQVNIYANGWEIVNFIHTLTAENIMEK